MSQAQAVQRAEQPFADRALKVSGAIWFAVAVVGQWTFVYFIVAFYGESTFTGAFEEWNKKPLIDGHKPDDLMGNLMFAAHVVLAAIITLGGTLQLMPQLRNRALAFHRWNGRVFIVVALIMAVGGLWLTWVRGTYLSLVSAVGISFNAVLIIIFAIIAWRLAVRRDIDAHRRWAMRAFIMVSGVWFLRVGMMAWVIIAQGPVGMTRTMDGPVDAVLAFGKYLIPLAFLELYFWAQSRGTPTFKLVTATTVLVMTGIMGIGIFGTYMFMWAPYL